LFFIERNLRPDYKRAHTQALFETIIL